MHFIDFVVNLDSHPQIQNLINAGCVGTTGLLALAPLIKNRAPRYLHSLQRPWLFIALVAISLVACRYPVFFYPTILNPDEAHMLSAAITFESYPIPWRDLDGTTLGPLDNYVLLWCYPLGIQPSYLTGRILELACVFGIFVFTYAAAFRMAGDLSARLALMPAFIFLCWTVDDDFIHCSTEELPVLLLSCALYLLTKLHRTPATIYTTLLLGFVLGVAPFAKLQSGLLVGFIGLTAIWFALDNPHFTRRIAIIRILTLIATSLVPALIILCMVIWAGALKDFWQSYFVVTEFYGTHYSTLGDKLSGYLSLFESHLRSMQGMAYPFYLSGISSILLIFYVLIGKQKLTRLTRRWFALTSLCFVTSVVTVLFSGLSVRHYQFFLLPSLILLMAANLRGLGVGSSPRATYASVPVLCAALLCDYAITINVLLSMRVLPSLATTLVWLSSFLLVVFLSLRAFQMTRQSWSSQMASTAYHKLLPFACQIVFFLLPAIALSYTFNRFRGNVGHFLSQPQSAMDQAILHVRPPGGRIAIWGWAPEFSAETGTPLGTRDSICLFMIEPNPYLDYYRRRYLHDMQTNRPALFLDATGPSDDRYKNHRLYGMERFPELATLISDQYIFDRETDGARLYVRRDLVHGGISIPRKNKN